MNTPKILAVGILAATALLSTASAQTKIYITGSTAFRAATTLAIDGVLSGTVTKASDNATFTSANAVTWTGGNIGGTAVTIKASWSGSTGGFQVVAGSLPVRFLPDGATGTANPDPRNVANPAEIATPDVGMGDSTQSSTPFTAGSLVNGGPATYANLTQTPVGIVAFTFMGSTGFPSGKSMSKKAFEYQYAGLGYVPLSTYTGDPLDVTGTRSIVYAFGRDPDSGTRTITLAETGYGVNNAVTQFKPTVSGTTITALGNYPATTLNGILYAGANMGESSGGTLRAFMNKTLTSGAYQNGETGPSYGVTYVGASDFLSTYVGSITDSFGTLTGSGPAGLSSVPLAWNGVSYNRDNIVNGNYTFWSTQVTHRRPTLGNGTTGGPAVKLAFYTNLSNGILGTATSALQGNVKFGDMQVSRLADGGQITNNNF